MTQHEQDQEHEGRTAKAFAALTDQQQEPEPSRDATVCPSTSIHGETRMNGTTERERQAVEQFSRTRRLAVPALDDENTYIALCKGLRVSGYPDRYSAERDAFYSFNPHFTQELQASTIRTALGLYRSCIKSGEEWTPVCDAAWTDAESALAGLMAHSTMLHTSLEIALNPESVDQSEYPDDASDGTE